MITTINEYKKLKIKKINENVQAFKTLPENMYIKITSDEVRSIEDSYEEGEIGKTTYTYSESGVDLTKLYKSVEEISNQIDSNINPNSWIILDDRILCTVMCNENGDIVSKETDPQLFKDFELGNINLYTTDYDFTINIINKKEYTTQELSDLLGIKNYG